MGRPDLDDPRWFDRDGVRILIDYDFPSITVDPELVRWVTSYNRRMSKNDRFKNSKFDPELALIFVIKRKKKVLYIGSTYRALDEIVKINLSRKLAKTGSFFDRIRGSYNGLTITGVEYIHHPTPMYLTKRKKYYETASAIDPETYRTAILEQLKRVDPDGKLKRRDSYLFIYQDREEKPLVAATVGCDDHVRALHHAKRNLKIPKEVEFKLIDRKRGRVRTLTEMYLEADILIRQYHATERGYNTRYRVLEPNKLLSNEQIEERLFLMINKDLVELNFDDPVDYPRNMFGFVYLLTTPEKESYVGLAYEKMKPHLLSAYERLIDGQKIEIENLLSSYGFFELKMKLIRYLKPDDDVKTVRQKYLEKYDAISSGFNQSKPVNMRQIYAIRAAYSQRKN